MSTWKLLYKNFVPEEENLREALCTLGNGYFGTRGASPETVATKVHYPGTYIAGVYNTLVTEISGKKIANEDFVNCPNWLILNFNINNGPWFDRLKVRILTWKQELNLRKGMLSRRVRWQDEAGRITLVENHRIVSMADPHYGALRCTITPENYDGKITVRSGLDGLIINAGVERYKQLNSKHLEGLALGKTGDDGVFLQMRTNQSGIRVSEALRTLVYADEKRLRPAMKILTTGKERIGQEFTLDVKRRKKYTVEKIVGIFTSRDQGVPDDGEAAREAVGKVGDFEALYKPHCARWRALWNRFDIQVEGDDFTQLALRFHIFHLLQVASAYNEEIDAGLPARGLHGEAYRGHIFWDELFALPFYNWRAPEITRALLMYRYRRLPAAKENASRNGCRGAMYPWQSAGKGDETSQVLHLNPMSGKWGPDYSALQRHISIAVAYNVWTYFVLSGDREFLEHYGAEMLLEISRFWSGICVLNGDTKKYEIRGVMGPDEFHEKYPGAAEGGLNNNAYTNVMVVWLMDKALRALDTLTEEERGALLAKTGIGDAELDRWRDVAGRMYVPVDKNGLIHQFDGYMRLKELDWDQYRAKYGDIHRVDRILKAEGLSPDAYKASKQADALMIFYVLNDGEIRDIFRRLGLPYSKNMLRKNFDYYIRRTSHGSTLSRVVHAAIAERLGDEETAFRFFQDALASDLRDIQGGTTQEGIHVGVMGGSVDLFLRSYMDLAVRGDCLCLGPRIPARWKKVRLQVRFKNIWFRIEADKKKLNVSAEPIKGVAIPPPREVPLTVGGDTRSLKTGKTYTFSLSR